MASQLFSSSRYLCGAWLRLSQLAVAKPWGITPCCESDKTSVDVVGYDSIVSMKGGQSCMKKRNFKKNIKWNSHPQIPKFGGSSDGARHQILGLRGLKGFNCYITKNPLVYKFIWLCSHHMCAGEFHFEICRSYKLISFVSYMVKAKKKYSPVSVRSKR